jgi:hypothetical protein
MTLQECILFTGFNYLESYKIINPLAVLASRHTHFKDQDWCTAKQSHFSAQETASSLWRHLLQLSVLYVVRSDGKSVLLLQSCTKAKYTFTLPLAVFASRHTHFQDQDWCAAKQSLPLPTAETASPDLAVGIAECKSVEYLLEWNIAK